METGCNLHHNLSCIVAYLYTPCAIDHRGDQFYFTGMQRNVITVFTGHRHGRLLSLIHILLEYTDKTILEVAMEYGYDNGSKFAAAFRSVKGVNPAQYRNEVHRKSKTIQTEPFSVF